MNKTQETDLTDQYLKSLEGMADAETSPFFYTRLKSRMQTAREQWIYPLKPSWMIGTLAVLLLMNSLILVKQSRSESNVRTIDIKNFAAAYDQSISPNF